MYKLQQDGGDRHVYRDHMNSYEIDIRYPPESHLKLNFAKFRSAITFFSFLSCSIVSQFCTEHDSDTVVLNSLAESRKDWSTEIDVIGEKVWAKYESSWWWVSKGT